MIISLQNRQRRVAIDVRWMRRFAELALPICVEESADRRFRLKHLPEVSVVVVSDRVIARLHLDFMGIAGPTDVITFQHGEIVVSAETAAEQAKGFGHSVEAELALYTVHGLLHLNGFDDTRRRERSRMHRVQDRLWRQVLALHPLP